MKRSRKVTPYFLLPDVIPKRSLPHESGRRTAADSLCPEMDTPTNVPLVAASGSEKERLAYSLHEAAALLGVDYFSVYRLVQRGKLRVCRALRGKLLVPRSELLRLLKS
jgi:excisionase family DNA binding protein